jgi:Trp operon repressor
MSGVDNNRKVGKILDLFLSLSEKDKMIVRSNLGNSLPKDEMQIEG